MESSEKDNINSSIEMLWNSEIDNQQGKANRMVNDRYSNRKRKEDNADKIPFDKTTTRLLEISGKKSRCQGNSQISKKRIMEEIRTQHKQ